MASAMSSNDSFRIANNSHLVERKCFRTSIEWRVNLQDGRNKIDSPNFWCSNLSWRLTYSAHHGGSWMSVPTFYLLLVDNISSSIFVPYFKLIVKDSAKRIMFEHAGVNHLLNMHDKKVTIALQDIGLLQCKSSTISFNLYVEDKFSPETTKDVKEIDEKKIQCGNRGCMSMCSDFEELFNKSRMSDVTLKLSDGEFQAHKVVLSARSKVFAAMFEHKTKERRTDTVDIVEMEAKTLQDMLRYVYCGKVRELSLEEALNLFVAADRYDMQELKTFCREVILNGISTSNVCDVAAVADLHNEEALIKKLKCFLFENGKKVVKTEKWKVVSAKNPSLGLKMFEWAFSD